jgi:urease accessory protein
VTAGPSTALGAGAGYVRAVRGSGGGTVLTHVQAASPLRLFTPRVSDRAAWVVTSTLGGGIVGGDHIHLSVEVGDAAHLWLTTQASTKIYRSPRPALQTLDADVAREGLLVSWPDPNVAFEGAMFEQRQRYRLQDRATLVAVDCVLSGREARGERWAFDRYASRIEVERDGSPIFLDAVRLGGADGPLGNRMGRFQAYAVCVLTGPMVAAGARAKLDEVAGAPVDRDEDVVISAAPLTHDTAGGVVLRFAATSPERLAEVMRDHLPVPQVPVRENQKTVENYVSSCT